MRNRILLVLVLSMATSTIIAQQTAVETPQAKAKKTLAGLSLQRKVAQLICAEISGDVPANDPRRTNWLSLVKDHGVGGFFISGGTVTEAALLINKLQGASAIPILISTDFEGGVGQQFKGATEFPPNMAFAAAGDENLMRSAAKVMAKEGKSVGVQLTYSPMVDITLSPDNPQESGRSFGGDVRVINAMTKSYVSAYHQEGMMVAAKHFPGRGDMRGGPAYPSFTTLNKDIGQLDKLEFAVFSQAIASGVDFVMTEHIAVPPITGGMLPATVEPKLVKDILRTKLNFKGFITTNDLWYDHVVARFGADEVAVLALEAGHDIVLKPKNPVTAIQAIVDAVKRGRIASAQIDSSVYKLLVKKYELNIDDKRAMDLEGLQKTVGTPAYLKLAQEVADKSMTLLRNDGVLPLKQFNPERTVHITVQKTADQPNVEALKKALASAFQGINQFSLVPGQDKQIYSEMLNAAGRAEVVIISLFVQRDRHGDTAPLAREVAAMLDGMSSSVPGKVVVMSFGNPYLVTKFPHARAFVTGYGEGGLYGNQTVYIASLVSLLKGELSPTGKLPITVSKDFPLGFGLQYTK